MSASPMLPPPMKPTRLPLTLMRRRPADRAGTRRSRCRPGPWSRPPRSPPRSRRSCPSTPRAARACRPSRAGAEPGARLLGALDLGGNDHEPADPHVGEPAIASSASRTTSGAKPPLLASLATFTSSSTSTMRPAPAARRSSSRASSRRSTEWMRSNSASASLTLLVCRWPMRCHGTGRPSSAILALASWTRFSPSARPRRRSRRGCARPRRSSTRR